MGGYASGRSRTVNRGSIEDFVRIDIRALRRGGHLRRGSTTAYLASWSSSNRYQGHALITVTLGEDGAGHLRIASGQVSGDGIQIVSIEPQPCRFGGYRYYFVCPWTQRRVEILTPYFGMFVSRLAAGLTYQSQSETYLDRTLRAKRKAAARAFGKEGQPPPRGRNRERLLARLSLIEQKLNVFEEWFLGTLG